VRHVNAGVSVEIIFNKTAMLPMPDISAFQVCWWHSGTSNVKITEFCRDIEVFQSVLVDSASVENIPRALIWVLEMFGWIWTNAIFKQEIWACPVAGGCLKSSGTGESN
jgi:hypothetical protein